jgi:hypothetical protein
MDGKSFISMVMDIRGLGMNVNYKKCQQSSKENHPQQKNK